MVNYVYWLMILMHTQWLLSILARGVKEGEVMRAGGEIWSCRLRSDLDEWKKVGKMAFTWGTEYWQVLSSCRETQLLLEMKDWGSDGAGRNTTAPVSSLTPPSSQCLSLAEAPRTLSQYKGLKMDLGWVGDEESLVQVPLGVWLWLNH